MKTVPLSQVFLMLRDIAYQINVDELDADYEQHLQRERDKPPDNRLEIDTVKPDSGGKDARSIYLA